MELWRGFQKDKCGVADPCRASYYSPFGLGIKPLEREGVPNHRWNYNGKELEETTAWHEYGQRDYDSQIGRFHKIDRFAEKYEWMTPYQYASNSPIRNIDVNGDSTFVTMNDDGTYTVTGGNLDNPEDRGVYLVGEDGEYTSIGNSMTSYSFFDNEGNAVVGAVIDLNSTEGHDFINEEIIEDDPNIMVYMYNATGGQPLDFKTRGIDERAEGTTRLQYMYRGSMMENGEIGSARDFGNMGAGIIAGRNNLTWGKARLGFDGLQSIQELSPAQEGPSTQAAQRVGFKIGVSLMKKDRPKVSIRARTRQRELKKKP